MFKKVLIANRGEIACRIAATLRELGVRSVAVFSDADRGALHARAADEAVPIDAANPRASYLDGAAIVAAARGSGADAIHPGYGFLAESPGFASMVEAAGIAFIGPTSDQILAMGDKRSARALAQKASVPVVPGAEGADPNALVKAAETLGYPVMVKAALGGGGKGMRAVESEAALREAIDSARRVAASAFGDDSVYLEKRIDRPRHVEVQVLGDGRGRAIHLFERECSLQRRHQKVIEESPSPGVDDLLRVRLCAAAVALAQAVRYRGAGTVEFLLDPEGHFYFLEMNTRLQVEHPVTEWVTGLDLVRLQLEVAARGELPFAQEAVTRRGHAIEARVYAEDPAGGFLPQAGTAVEVRWPRAPFVRVDAGLEAGGEVSVHYDPLIAKIIACGADRASALARLAAALDEARVQGVVTNLPFLRALARAPEVAGGRFDTDWIEREFMSGFTVMAAAPAPELAVAAAALAEHLGVATPRAPAKPGVPPARPDPFARLGRWRQPGLD